MKTRIYTAEEFKSAFEKAPENVRNRVGVWRVVGEDPNCDMGGPHIQPLLGIVRGTYEQALRWALKQYSFVTWGGGGEVIPVDVIELQTTSFDIPGGQS